MIQINKENEIIADFVISANTIPYLVSEGVEIISKESYTSNFLDAKDDYYVITIKVTNLTLLLLIHAGIRCGTDSTKKIYNLNR